VLPQFSILITCEHAGNQVPVRYQSVFENNDVLNSPLAWDPGALDMAVGLSTALDVPCFVHQTTRLLVEVNCSVGNPMIFSEFSKPLGDEDKQLLLNKYYFPYRLRVENAIAKANKPVLHLSVHSFAPDINGGGQFAQIEIHIDAQRAFEKQISKKLINSFNEIPNPYRIQVNELHHKADDRFVAYLRTYFADEEYAGIEIYVNQDLADTPEIENIVAAIQRALLVIV
jgi:predicted N-formylglutamate amidohydrolase